MSRAHSPPRGILHTLATSSSPLIEDPRAPLADRLRALIIKAEAAGLAPQPPTAGTAEAPGHGRYFPKSTSEPGVAGAAVSEAIFSDQWGSRVDNIECETTGRLTAGMGSLFKSYPSFPSAILNPSPSGAAVFRQDLLLNRSGSSGSVSGNPRSPQWHSPRSPHSPRASASPRSPHSPRSPARHHRSFASRLAARGPSSASQKLPPPSVAHLIPERPSSQVVSGGDSETSLLRPLTYPQQQQQNQQQQQLKLEQYQHIQEAPMRVASPFALRDAGISPASLLESPIMAGRPEPTLGSAGSAASAQAEPAVAASFLDLQPPSLPLPASNLPLSASVSPFHATVSPQNMT
ncbi:unnamed protein product, partial [Closterium sp. NIES-53]